MRRCLLYSRECKSPYRAWACQTANTDLLSLIILAVFGLLIGHPGLAFWRGDTAARLTAIQLH
jgi:hypothetical protein